MRPSRDEMFMGIAGVVSTRSTCPRLQVGCVLVDGLWHVMSTGYNGRASGLHNCSEYSSTEPRCRGYDAPIGQPNGCEAVHAEQNALLQCRDVYRILACYCTHSPCLVCVKLLLNTTCRHITYLEEYPSAQAEELWLRAGRTWRRLTLSVAGAR